jgi:hypothetical protein
MCPFPIAMKGASLMCADMIPFLVDSHNMDKIVLLRAVRLSIKDDILLRLFLEY